MSSCTSKQQGAAAEAKLLCTHTHEAAAYTIFKELLLCCHRWRIGGSWAAQQG
jgi:hypothetical protein